MSKTHDAIIIGAGIIGAATAFALGRAGRKVLVIDKLPASGYASSGPTTRPSTARRWPTRATSTGATGPSSWASRTSAA